MKYLRRLLIRIWPWYRNRHLYVIADPRDNSITFSKVLYELIEPQITDEAKVFVFTLANAQFFGVRYAFCLNPTLAEETQLCDIQFNPKHKTIGFETLCPTVNAIFYDYHLMHDLPVKLSVSEGKAGDITYYTLLRP